MGLREVVKNILPLPARSTRSEFDKAMKKIDALESDIRKTSEKLEAAIDKKAHMMGSKLDDAVEQVYLSKRKINDTSFYVGKVDEKLSKVALQESLNDVRSRLWGNERAVTASAAATMSRHMLEHLDYHLVDHCNLNCACCSTYSPIAPKRFASLETFERDLMRLHEVVGDKVLRLHLLGGEPLLHPELEKFLFVARSTFPDARIDVTTNGLLVAAMGDSFWDAMKENRIDLKYTQYPINVDYGHLVDMAAEKGIFAFSAGQGEIDYFRRIPLNPKGTFNVHETYIRCPYIDCPQLKEGVLYRCPASAYADILNEKMQECGQAASFHVSALDHLDLNDDISEEDVLEFLSRPIPFCQYCDMGNVNSRIEWGNSTRSIEEWVDLT